MLKSLIIFLWVNAAQKCMLSKVKELQLTEESLNNICRTRKKLTFRFTHFQPITDEKLLFVTNLLASSTQRWRTTSERPGDAPGVGGTWLVDPAPPPPPRLTCCCCHGGENSPGFPIMLAGKLGDILFWLLFEWKHRYLTEWWCANKASLI